ncbi:MAG: EVE domain-containing protein, partial [Bdellovibrionales bacterium]
QGPARPDASALDKKSESYDPKSTFENPRWFGVEVKYVSTFPKMISLEEIKLNPLLKNMVLVNNSRLSVQPVSEKEFHLICSFHKENKYHEPEKSL